MFETFECFTLTNRLERFRCHCDRVVDVIFAVSVGHKQRFELPTRHVDAAFDQALEVLRKQLRVAGDWVDWLRTASAAG